MGGVLEVPMYLHDLSSTPVPTCGREARPMIMLVPRTRYTVLLLLGRDGASRCLQAQ